jgi:hypothetical protein
MDLVYFTPLFTRETLHQDFTLEEKINFTASKLEAEMSSPRTDPTQSRASHSTNFAPPNFAAIEGS